MAVSAVRYSASPHRCAADDAGGGSDDGPGAPGDGPCRTLSGPDVLPSHTDVSRLLIFQAKTTYAACAATLE